jgi:hypothetical protein
MTATTVARKEFRKQSPFEMDHEFTYATSASALKGTMVCLNASGLGCNPDGANALFVIGVLKTPSVASAAAGQKGEATQGMYWFENGGSFTAADVGKPCYAADNQTVNATATNPVAGVIDEVHPVKGVCVKIDKHANRMLLPVLTVGGILQGSATGLPSNLAIGTANQIPKVNAGATALEYAADAT